MARTVAEQNGYASTPYIASGFAATVTHDDDGENIYPLHDCGGDRARRGEPCDRGDGHPLVDRWQPLNHRRQREHPASEMGRHGRRLRGADLRPYRWHPCNGNHALERRLRIAVGLGGERWASGALRLG